MENYLKIGKIENINGVKLDKFKFEELLNQYIKGYYPIEISEYPLIYLLRTKENDFYYRISKENLNNFGTYNYLPRYKYCDEYPNVYIPNFEKDIVHNVFFIIDMFLCEKPNDIIKSCIYYIAVNNEYYVKNNKFILYYKQDIIKEHEEILFNFIKNNYSIEYNVQMNHH